MSLLRRIPLDNSKNQLEDRSTASSADDILDDLDSYLEKVSDYDQHSLLSTKSSRHSRQMKKTCETCRNAPYPLVSSVETNHKDCLIDILLSSVNINICGEANAIGDTTAHLAAKDGRIEFLKLLYAHDRNIVDAKDHKGASPVHIAAYYGHLGCVRWILQNGGTVFQKDFDGATPAHYASAQGHLLCLEELVPQQSGLANEQTYSGETPGIEMMQNNFVRFILIMWNHGGIYSG